MVGSVLCLWQAILLVSASQKYSEDLFIKDLPDGKIMATFDFVTAWNVNPVTFVEPSPGMRKHLLHGFFIVLSMYKYHYGHANKISNGIVGGLLQVCVSRGNYIKQWAIPVINKDTPPTEEQ